MTTASHHTLQELRNGIDKLKNLETELELFSQWQPNQDADSPRGVVEHTSLIQRYQAAKNYYLQNRLSSFLIEKIQTFDESKPNHFDFPDEEDLKETSSSEHDEALASLQTCVDDIQTQVSNLRDAYEAVTTKREELEQMVRDLQEDDGDIMDYEDVGGSPVEEGDISLEQERIDELQRKKRRLQEQLESIRKERYEVEEKVRHNENDIIMLKQQTDGQDAKELQTKVQELREMKLFYDSLREVLEELGGVKVLEVKEDSNTHLLHLMILLYDEFKVQIDLEVYRKSSLKLVSATWITDPVIHYKGDDDDKDLDTFSLSMTSLDDIVQVARTNLAPPHDVRFVVRESLARIRIQRDRVNDLAILRRHVLTKVVDNHQIVCSLNDGIIIVMRLYDNLVRVEQIVGVSGWDEATTEMIRLSIETNENITPTSIVEHVQSELKRLKEGGMNPRTPTMPKRREIM